MKWPATKGKRKENISSLELITEVNSKCMAAMTTVMGKDEAYLRDTRRRSMINKPEDRSEARARESTVRWCSGVGLHGWLLLRHERCLTSKFYPLYPNVLHWIHAIIYHIVGLG